MYRDFLPKPIKRAEIIMFIADYLEKNCYFPTLMEIMKGVNLKSKSSVWHHLEKMGLVGGRGKEGLWLQNKKEMENELICPTCQRPLFGTLDEWERRRQRKRELRILDNKIDNNNKF